MSNPTFDESKVDKTNSNQPQRRPKDGTKEGAQDAAPSVSQVDRMIAEPQSAVTRNVIAADELDLGEVYVGRLGQDVEVTPFFNMVNASASLSCRVEGDPNIVLLRSRDSLAPKTDRAADQTLTFRVLPQREGYMHSTLVASIAWPGQASESFRIPLKAAAHYAGTPTLDEREEQERKKVEARTKEQDDREAEEKVDREIAKESKRKDAPHHGDEKALDDATDLAEKALTGIYNQQRSGIDNIAKGEIGEFKRKLPPQETSFLRSVAWAALDLGLTAITGGVSKAIETAVKKSGITGAGILGSLVGSGLSAGLKKGKEATIDAVKNPGSGTPKHETTPAADGSFSYDPKGSFFAAQTRALNWSESNSGADSILKVNQSLRPLLRTDPQKAVAKMHAVKDGLSTQHDEAEKHQAQKSVEQWLRLVTATTVGTGAAAAEPYGEKRPQSKIDGLLDIRFQAHQARPNDPVKLESARLLGVRNPVIQRIQNTDLMKAHIPIRISTNFNSADQSVAVVRDAEGNITHDENTQGSGPTSANWLGRHAGASRSPSDGAAKLVKEVLAQPLPKIQGDSQA